MAVAARMRAGGKGRTGAGEAGQREGEKKGLGKPNRHHINSMGAVRAPAAAGVGTRRALARGAQRDRRLSEKRRRGGRARRAQTAANGQPRRGGGGSKAVMS
ncbi:MAG: hypothetical protein Kow00114_02600 [Kiloniellaceae bacterium]